MTPLQTSLLAWIGGGIIGAAVSRRHRVAGFALGAIVTGAIGDKLIERYHPTYHPAAPLALAGSRRS